MTLRKEISRFNLSNFGHRPYKIPIDTKRRYTDDEERFGKYQRQRFRRSKYDVSHLTKKDYTTSDLPNNLESIGPRLSLKPMKERTVFTDEQMFILETAYHRTDRPDNRQKELLAELCQLDFPTVKVWFQNRKAKEKRMKEDELAAFALTLKQGEEKSFERDPIHNIYKRLNQIFEPDTTTASSTDEDNMVRQLMKNTSATKHRSNNNKKQRYAPYAREEGRQRDNIVKVTVTAEHNEMEIMRALISNATAKNYSHIGNDAGNTQFKQQEKQLKFNAENRATLERKHLETPMPQVDYFAGQNVDAFERADYHQSYNNDSQGYHNSQNYHHYQNYYDRQQKYPHSQRYHDLQKYRDPPNYHDSQNYCDSQRYHDSQRYRDPPSYHDSHHIKTYDYPTAQPTTSTNGGAKIEELPSFQSLAFSSMKKERESSRKAPEVKMESYGQNREEILGSQSLRKQPTALVHPRTRLKREQPDVISSIQITEVRSIADDTTVLDGQQTKMKEVQQSAFIHSLTGHVNHIRSLKIEPLESSTPSQIEAPHNGIRNVRDIQNHYQGESYENLLIQMQREMMKNV